MNCLILMATYNGKKYVCQQIESIINQTFKNWKLIIRDDGSSDGTVEKIQFYVEKDSRIYLLQNTTDKHGAYSNFWTLIEYAHSLDQYDYYFFADQDDVWIVDKLSKMINYAETLSEKGKPLLIYSDMEIIDGEGNQVCPSLNAVMGSGEMKGLSLFFSHGFIWGCSVMINRALFAAVPTYPLNDPNINIMAHDSYYGKFALVLGSVEFINTPLIRYRRHDSNTTRVYKLKLSPFSVIKKAFFQYGDLVKTHARVYNQTLLTIKQMENVEIDTKNTDLIKKAICRGGIQGTYILKKFGVGRKQRSRTMGIYIVMLLESYKKYLIVK